MCDRAVVSSSLVLALLLRDHAGGCISPAQIGRARELGFCLAYFDVRLRRLQLRLRGNELCIELRGFDLRQDLSLLHAVTDVDVPFRYIPVHSRIDRAFIPGVRLAG